MDVYAPSGRYENRLSFTFFATCIPVKYMAPQPGRQQSASGYVSPTDCWLTPQSLEPCRIGCRVHDRMLHIPLTQIVLMSRVSAPWSAKAKPHVCRSMWGWA